ncbi:protein phosphatase regulatory subunit Sds22 [Didymosphaeria variabile]|uniref:Protein phosphatase regulatory subunit Sds22 n=1 Tax=Didymosphaeria variabile TaxID=1932322 RepID=A0A9W8XQH7_9PLEO|nr:protein phosphatase regulatory subunit Sds22 [Didymosphaeria variabile]KAJ4355716.1 protein phosphatase regulatory subunit Sds22 [Didymosphaeria variabile]
MADELGKAPRIDPAVDAAGETHNAEIKKGPRDSKGWDGKLRMDKSVLVNGKDQDAESEADDASEDEGPPPEQLPADEDLLEDYPEDEEDIELVHMRVSNMAALRLERFKKLKRLGLRQNQITNVDIPEDIAPQLEDLDFYDNLISHVKGFDACKELVLLDLSFNKIKHIKRINHLAKLKDLFFVQNKISTIEGLEGLTNLRQVELGANRIREIQNLETLTGLEQLWLGKNKITELKGLDTLANLKILSIQSNRLTSFAGLSKLKNLEELYISHNAINEIAHLEENTNLRVVDISSNPIQHLKGLESLEHLQEFWASNCQLGDFNEVEKQLKDKEELETVYFEGNPLQKSQPVLYRNKVRLALPQIRQIDASKLNASRPEI